MQKEVQAPHLASYIVSSILEAGRVDDRLNVVLPKVIMKKPDNALILVTMTITSRC